MTNETTIDEIMAAVITSQVATTAYDGSSGPGTDELERAMFSADGEVRDLITAALAAKDAEIERLKAQLAEPAKPAPGEWIEWAGGQQPVPDGVLCKTRLEDGDEGARLAENWVWEHDEFGANIVAYRVLA